MPTDPAPDAPAPSPPPGPTPPGAVLLDMDGTLVATEPLWSEVIAALAAAHDARWDPEVDDPRLVGMLVPDLVDLLRGRGVRATPEELTDALVTGVADLIGTRPPWRPGALDLLDALAGRGIPTALVTTSVRRHAHAVTAAAPSGALRVVVAAEDVAHHKPHPEAYQLALSRLGATAASAVALEDSVPGLRAALAADVTVLAVQPRTLLPDDVGCHLRLRRVGSLDEARVALGLG
ncbi:HAD family hydrolase [Cellulomonas hominis]